MTPLSDLIGPNAAPAPEIAGYDHLVPEWSMGGNDTAGDCSYVAIENLDDVVSAINGHPEVMMPAEALHFYTIQESFQPTDKSTDRGALLPDVINYWTTEGWPGDPEFKARGWCEIGFDEVHQAIHSLGGVPLWVKLPMNADGDDYDFSDDAVTRQALGVGPHSILAVRSSPEGFWIVTWAKVVPISEAWLRTYGKQFFAVLHPERVVPTAQARRISPNA